MSTRSSRNPIVDSHRAKVGGLSRHYGADAPAVITAKRDLEAELLALHIERVVTQDPPLTVEQRDRLAALLRSQAGVA